MRLKGQVAVVTGAAQGIGAAIARRLIAEGADLAAVDIAPINVDDFLAGSSTSSRIQVFECDVTSSSQVARTCAAINNEFGASSILVNNAGAGGPDLCDDIETLTDENWDFVLSACLSSTMRFTRGLVGPMRAKGYGRIVNISSTLRNGVYGPVPTMRGRIPYITAKMALIGLTRQCAKDLGPFGINANVVGPGLTLPGPDAKITLRFNALSPEEKHELIGRNPLGRPASGEDVASAALFLALPESGYINGQTIDVDGGN